MIVDLSQTQRALLLRQLRNAVALQIELWEVTSAMAEHLRCELDEVAEEVQSFSITADTGLELNFDDLDELLGIGLPLVRRGGPLPNACPVQ